jgi:hypothetical protein
MSMSQVEPSHQPPASRTPARDAERKDGAAVIANAVFHATGKRVRDLPLTLDKLL